MPSCCLQIHLAKRYWSGDATAGADQQAAKTKDEVAEDLSMGLTNADSSKSNTSSQAFGGLHGQLSDVAQRQIAPSTVGADSVVDMEPFRYQSMPSSLLIPSQPAAGTPSSSSAGVRTPVHGGAGFHKNVAHIATQAEE